MSKIPKGKDIENHLRFFSVEIELGAPRALSLRPQNGSMILYNRKKVKYRKDGYCWKKRKDGKTTREDHMKLKVQGVEWRVAEVKQLRSQVFPYKALASSLT
uniref:Uncharacterized protein n=1 Tax=Sphaerodactylus townsendi TaxID=933632 RepID=A0ACB8EDG6_9SAUR